MLAGADPVRDARSASDSSDSSGRRETPRVAVDGKRIDNGVEERMDDRAEEEDY